MGLGENRRTGTHCCLWTPDQGNLEKGLQHRMLEPNVRQREELRSGAWLSRGSMDMTVTPHTRSVSVVWRVDTCQGPLLTWLPQPDPIIRMALGYSHPTLYCRVELSACSCFFLLRLWCWELLSGRSQLNLPFLRHLGPSLRPRPPLGMV